MFRVYHEGVLQGTTPITNYTVWGLLPCQQYQAKVEAVCGEDVVLSTKMITVHTGNVNNINMTVFSGWDGSLGSNVENEGDM